MMKKIIALGFIVASLGIKAQNFGTLNAILDRLEERRGFNQDLSGVSLDGKKFVSIKDFEDRTEREFIVFTNDKVNYIELLDAKPDNKTSSKVYDGDFIRKKNIVSIRADKLEGQKIPIAVTKTLMLNREKEILYLIDINTKQRWIDEQSITKQPVKK
ncbi:hypothetical protein OKE80_08765 [Riemerella anatipestifer]|uniref:Beta-lactamase-inhibitor-like PepSY-like domain-containing protein n=2 Tax=Riemerella anatipestifer TaxID=34085 RepID=A0AAP6LMN5_RIEAN|nr:hypothetical protein [Riemerella anatipestifer]MCD5968150.1 hypothetical protein [Riemerella anatipestifer]MCE3025287.1 hypothetical protein [Riemerella anatipestifer]MCO7319411.1 hypothetical protein [Riemerella anatipestifer]MCO7354464.1 hypothetical protein [Riemerella anatipestifer]MCQ4155731.1 hypothetical protein [Riemerella anatipestifer]